MTSIQEHTRRELATVSFIVSIVNYRAAALTIECLRSIEDERKKLQGCHVIVVDNGSDDDSAEKIGNAIESNGWGHFAHFIPLNDNCGFAAGNNAAIRAGFKLFPETEFVLLLNPDTVVRPEAFDPMLEFMLDRTDVGITGGRSEDPDTTPQACCFRFPGPLSEFALYLRIGLVGRLLEPWLTQVPIPEEPRQIDWVSGAFMMIRKEIFDRIGLMDETYFLYFEETDFTLRARRSGWTCWHLPQCRVVHYVGQSSGVTRRDQAPKRVPGYWFESRTRYFLINYGWLRAAVTDLLVTLACVIAFLRSRFSRNAPVNPPHFLKDLLRHSVLLRPFKRADERAISIEPQSLPRMDRG